jgi:hypothetical protein
MHPQELTYGTQHVMMESQFSQPKPKCQTALLRRTAASASGVTWTVVTSAEQNSSLLRNYSGLKSTRRRTIGCDHCWQISDSDLVWGRLPRDDAMTMSASNVAVSGPLLSSLIVRVNGRIRIRVHPDRQRRVAARPRRAARPRPRRGAALIPNGVQRLWMPP